MTNLTLTPTVGAAIPVPDEGEDITAATGGAGKGPVRPAFQELGNRSEFTWPRAQMAGIALAGAGAWLKRPYLRTTTTVLGVGPLAGAFPDSNLGNGYRGVGTSVETQFAAASILEPAGALSSNTWYFVYGRVVAGQLTYVIRADGPDPALRFRALSAADAYLGCFRTVGSGNIVPMRRSAGGLYVYEEPQTVLIGGTATSYTTVSLANFVPANAQVCWLKCYGNNSDTSFQNLFVRTLGSSVNSNPVARVNPRIVVDSTTTPQTLSDWRSETTIALPVDNVLQSIEYKWSGGSPNLQIDVLGFEE